MVQRASGNHYTTFITGYLFVFYVAYATSFMDWEFHMLSSVRKVVITLWYSVNSAFAWRG